MSVLTQLLLLFAGVSVILPLIALALVKGFGDKTGHRVCYALLIVCAIRVLLPTGIGIPTILELPSASSLSSPPILTEGDEVIEETASPLPTPALPTQSDGTVDPEADTLAPPLAARLRQGLATYGWVTLLGIWSLGSVITLLVISIPQLRAIRRERAEASPADEATEALYQGICREMNIRKPPRLMKSKFPAIPHLSGFLRPMILLGNLPLEERQLNFILRHELTHHRRRDILVNWLLLIDLAVFWWNPAVRALIRQTQAEMELSCDEAITVRCTAEERCFYGETILYVLRDSIRKRAFHTLGFTPERRAVTSRFRALLNERAHRGGGALIGVMVGAIALSWCLIGGVSAAPLAPSNTPHSLADPILVIEGETDLSEDELRQLLARREVPQRSGYTTLGWRVLSTADAHGGYALSFEPILEPTAHQISLYSNGGDLGNTLRVLTCEDRLPTPKRAGYTFGGWYSDIWLTQRVTDVPQADTALYARWREETLPSAFTFAQKGAELTLTSYRGTDTSVVVPAYVGGVKVSAVGVNAFAFSTELTRLTLPSTVTRIGAGALRYCYHLQALTLQGIPTRWDRSVTEACYALSEIHFAGSEAQWQTLTDESDLSVRVICSPNP